MKPASPDNIRAAPALDVNQANPSLLVLPPQWSGIPLKIHRLPHCEERGPSYSDYPILFQVLHGQGQRKYRYGAAEMALATNPGGIEIHGKDYQREWARWDGIAGCTAAVHLTPQVLQRLAPRIPDFDLVTSHEFFDPKIQWLVGALIDEARSGAPAGLLYAESLLCALIAYLAQSYGQVKSRDLAAGGLSASNRRRVTDYIEAHLDEPLSIAVLAQQAGLSPDHFARCFAASFGQPPHRYVQQRRIEAALGMLSHSSRSISEIAVELGFYSHTHFTRVFRQQTGMTPSQARAG